MEPQEVLYHLQHQVLIFAPVDLAVINGLPLDSKQWGIISNNKAIFPLVFNVFVSSALLLSRGSGTGTWYGDNSNTTLTGISCVTPDYVLNGTYIAIGAQQQWGFTTNNNGTWALNFNTVLSAVVTGAPGYPAREFCGFEFNYTVTGWSFRAGYGGPGITYVNGIKVTAIALGF